MNYFTVPPCRVLDTRSMEDRSRGEIRSSTFKDSAAFRRQRDTLDNLTSSAFCRWPVSLGNDQCHLDETSA